MLELGEDAGDLAPGAALVRGDPAPVATVGHEDRLAVMVTSGTTSEPKGVVLTQANYAYVADVLAQAAGLQARHRWYVTLPLSTPTRSTTASRRRSPPAPPSD